MKKIVASCATLALFAQFTEAKVVEKTVQAKQKIENVNVDECECAKDPFAGFYVGGSIAYTSTKDKLNSDLTIVGKSGSALGDADAGNYLPGTPTKEDLQTEANDSNKTLGGLFDSVTVTKVEGAEANKCVAEIIGRKANSRKKSHTGISGGVCIGWLTKIGGNGYAGIEGSAGFGPDTRSTLYFFNTPYPTEDYRISLVRSGITFGLSGTLGWKVGGENVLYGKIGACSERVQVTPPERGKYTKNKIAPTFGVGMKHATSQGAVVGIEASYTLHQKISMNDDGKSNTTLGVGGSSGATGLYLLDAMQVDANCSVNVREGDATASVKSKRSGTWKIALSVSIPLK